jgi:hypothetical protein
MPNDDREFALDPDGEWYDEMVEMPVMQGEPMLVPNKSKKQKKKSRVSVSFYF